VACYQRTSLRITLCITYGCGYRKACFDADKVNTEFDALVLGDREKCIVEYEDKIMVYVEALCMHIA